MRNSLVLIFSLLFSGLIAQTPGELNDRAFEDIVKDPSIAFYYTDASLDSNIENREIEEYVRSYYYKYLIYRNLELDNEGALFLIKSYEVNSSNNFIYKDINYLRDSVEYFLNKDVDIAETLLSSSDIADNLDQRSLIEFRIMDFIKGIRLGEDVSNQFSQLVAATSSFGYKDLESEIYLILGESYIGSDSDSALTLFNRVIELNDVNYLTRAYIGISQIYLDRGNSYQSLLNLNKAYLNAQLISNDKETLIVAELLDKLYKRVSNNRDRVTILNSIIELNERRSKFILKERSELYKEDYGKRILEEDFRKSSFLVSIMIYIVIILSVALICVVVFLSIQTYRLRHLKLGHN